MTMRCYDEHVDDLLEIDRLLRSAMELSDRIEASADDGGELGTATDAIAEIRVALTDCYESFSAAYDVLRYS